MTSVEQAQRSRRRETARPPGPGRARNALAAALVGVVLLAWAGTVYVLVLTCDGLSATSSHTDWWAHVIAVAIIAATVEPVRRWLRRGVDDVVYGHPSDAYDLVTRLNRQIDAPPTPAEPDEDSSIALTIARTLGVPYVAVVDGDEETSVVGRRPAERDVTDLPLVYRGQVIGRLFVGSRHAGSPLSNAELHLLADLAHQLSVGMFAVRAAEQVQASRVALVTAREEERRRIRRDLHDGLGPSLASTKLQLAAVQRLLGSDPDRAAALLDEVRHEMNQTTAEIRRLVYGLRPPLLDELGLVGAIHSHPQSHAGIDVVVSPAEIPALPAAVEVALYRIATEAIHNAVRHSGGRRCDVSFAVVDDIVEMNVIDDGRGLPEPLIDGVGVSAMRERAAELGGAVRLLRHAGGGTVVAAVVPLRAGVVT